MKEGYISFIEVKYRSDTSFGMPYEAVDPHKQQKIIMVSRNYIKEKRLSYNNKYRYDVVSICGNKLTLIKNAFGGF